MRIVLLRFLKYFGVKVSLAFIFQFRVPIILLLGFGLLDLSNRGCLRTAVEGLGCRIERMLGHQLLVLLLLPRRHLRVLPGRLRLR